MTAPLPHGYPDYGRTYARTNITYHDVTDVDIDSAEFLPTVFVGDRAYLGTFFQSSVLRFQLILIFSQDVLAADVTTRHAFDIPAGGSLDVSVPITGAYVTPLVSPAAANGSYQLKTWGMDTPDTPSDVQSQRNVLVSFHGITIAGGVTRVDAATRTYPGPATWRVRSTATSWQGLLEVVDYLGAITILDRVGNDAAQDRSLVFLPNSNVQTRVANFDGVDRTFSIFVVAHPFGRYG